MTAPTTPPGRLRRAAGAVLLIAGTLALLLIFVSIKWWFGYSTTTWMADFGDGTLYTKPITHEWDRPLLGWTGGINQQQDSGSGAARSWTWTWWAWGQRPNTYEPGQAHSVWPLAPLMLIAGAFLYLPSRRTARRLRNNQCTACGYSRTGLPTTAPCPECASPAPSRLGS